MGKTLEMSAFLGHSTRSGTKSQFLSGWRKRNPPRVDVLLHTKAPIVALWQHNLPKIYEQKDKKGSITRRVFGNSFNCLEDESVLVKQYRRDRKTGERVLPPVLCPMCRLQEALLQCYEDGVIGFAETVFRWEGDDPNETQNMTLGGMLNLYGKDNLTDDEKDAMAEEGISMKHAWKENAHAKCNYLFCVVDTDEPEAGVQLAIETTALGDKVKECIHGQMTSMGEEEGNPMLNPYAIRWEHQPNESEFQKRYRAIAMQKIDVTHQLEELITGEPPDTDGVTRPGNITKLRAELEAHCVLDDPSVLPWDDIFGPAEKAGFGEDPEEEDDGDEVDEDAVEQAAKDMAAKKAAAKKKASKAAPAATGRRRKKVEPEPEPEPEPEEEEAEDEADDTIPCDECGHPMAPTDTTCPNCGAEYEVDEDPEPEPEPPPKKAASKKAASKKTSKKASSKGKIPF